MPRQGVLKGASGGPGPYPAPGWRVCRTGDGSLTLAHPGHGELCHSDAGAWQQARQRYALGCRLAQRARPDRPLRLLDVGTGLGWNLAAALEAVEGRDAPLAVWSLERDPAVIEAMLAACTDGPPADDDRERERWHAPVRRALADALAVRASGGDRHGRPLGRRGRLWLVLGDARRQLPALDRALRFDAVFLDPFSPRVEPDLWQPEFLGAVARRMAPGSWLATYSASLRVRVGLAAAGLRVGPGPRVGRKREGTLASPDCDPPPFDARTARRLARRLERERGGGRAANCAARELTGFRVASPDASS